MGRRGSGHRGRKHQAHQLGFLRQNGFRIRGRTGSPRHADQGIRLPRAGQGALAGERETPRVALACLLDGSRDCRPVARLCGPTLGRAELAEQPVPAAAPIDLSSNRSI